MVKVETAVREIVVGLVGQGKPFNLDSITRLLSDKSVDPKLVEKAMLKCYYVGAVGPDKHTYEIFVIDGNMAFAPGNMKVEEVENLLKSNAQIAKKVIVKTTPVVANTSKQISVPLNKNYVSDFYSPDVRGRVRIPVKLTRAIGLEPSAKASIVAVDGDVVVRANRKGKRVDNTYTVDRYGNLLFPVQDTSVNYRFVKVRNRVKVIPVTA